MDLHRAIRAIAATVSVCVVGSWSEAQSLVWTAHQDSGSGTPYVESAGSGLAAGLDGSVFALSLAYNGTYVGMLTKYQAAGITQNVALERAGRPLAVAADGQGRPAVLTPWQTLGYDADGFERWIVDHTTDSAYLEGIAIAAAGEGFCVAGVNWPFTGEPPRLGLWRLESSGRVAWRQTHLPEGSTTASVDSMGVDRAGRIYVGGRATFTAPEHTSHFVAAFDPDGSLLWSRLVEAPAIAPGDAVVQAVDPRGGIFLAWSGQSFEDFRIRRLDASGDTAWEVSSFLTSQGLSIPRYAVATPEGGVVVAGNEYALAGGRVLLAAHDAQGTQIFGVNASSGTLGGLVIDAAGRVVVEHSEATTLRVSAYDSSGRSAWSRELSGSPWDAAVNAKGLVASPAGRVFALADGPLKGLLTQFTVSYGATGITDYISTPGTIPVADWARAARLDPSGNALLLTTHFDHGYRDLVTKYDPTGLLLWSKEAFTGEPAVPVVAIATGPAGETVAVGSWDSPAPGEGPQVAKLDAAGNVLWRRGDLLAAPYDAGGATSVLVDAQGSAYVAGWVWDMETFDSPLTLAKYAADGRVLWRYYDPHPYAFTREAVRLTAIAGNRVALAGSVWLPKDGRPAIRVAVVDGATGGGIWTGFATEADSSVYVRTVVADATGAVLVGSEYPGRLYRFGPTGVLEWSRESPDAYRGQVNAISIDAGNEITVAFAAPACHLQRLSPAGDSLWERVVDFEGYCAALAPRASGGFFSVGSFLDPLDQSYHGYLAAFDVRGHAEWSRATGKQRGGESALHFLDADGSGRALAAGYGFFGATDYDALAIVVSDDPKPPAANFFTVAPCRVADTRSPGLGGPLPLPAGSQLDLSVAGRCGIPATARAIAANLTAVAPDSAGYFTAFPAGRMPPTASLLNHGIGTARASQAVLGLGDDGKLSLRAFQPAGGVHLLVDVAGYFE